MRLLVFDPFLKPDTPALIEAGAKSCQRLEDTLAEADFVTTHSPLTAETRHLFNARAFAAMQRGAFFINTSRGGVVDEASLLAALQSGHLGGAALDVREVEPPATRIGFEEMENVILAPQYRSSDDRSSNPTFETVRGYRRLLRGEAAVNFVNFARRSGEVAGSSKLSLPHGRAHRPAPSLASGAAGHRPTRRSE